ncbi:MAG: BamA/TamA family outer membrane protein [Candidatus Eisenbacteria bacterium]|nr:BamA/TamA family outer membrane protein [Candidatus Eisenbacteria bacterium]
MKRQLIGTALLSALLPLLAAGAIAPQVDELQIREDVILLRIGEHTYRLTDEQAALLREGNWETRNGEIVIHSENGLEMVIRAGDEEILPLPRPGEETRRRGIAVDRIEEGILFRFFQDGAEEVVIEGSFNDWNARRGRMRREGSAWTYETLLPRGTYQFRVLYRLEGDDHWFLEPEREQRLTGIRHNLFTLEVSDREAYWYIEEVAQNAVTFGGGARYNRVEGANLSYTLGLRRGVFHQADLQWTQGYSFAIERWTWETGLRLPVPIGVPGLSFGASGYDRIQIPEQWTVSSRENLAAALLVREDFYDYVWGRGWTVFLEERFGNHVLSGGYRENETEPVSKQTDWSLFGGAKKFRENLFSDSAGTAGLACRIEGRYAYDSRNYQDEPTKGSLLRLSGDYSGWELDGDFDYWRGVLDLRHYHKLSPMLRVDFRIMGGAIQGTAPLQERFYLGGVGTMRAHAFKELVGNRFLLANVEYRAPIFADLECVFFADLGDAWRTPERETFDLESDMGVGVQNDDGDVRVDFARRLNEGADEEIVVTFRFARTF